jgi:hypothetical protein
MIFFYLFCLIIGVFLLQFGLRLLFQKGFVERLQEGRWKDNSGLFSEKGLHFYNKYTMGVNGIIVGILALVIAIWGLIHG